MAKAKKIKVKKERAKNYDTKLAINGTFDDVIKLTVTPMPVKKEKKKK
jgi:hypothetical protein